jgi:hypothetical protein
MVGEPLKTHSYANTCSLLNTRISFLCKPFLAHKAHFPKTPKKLKKNKIKNSIIILISFLIAWTSMSDFIHVFVFSCVHQYSFFSPNFVMYSSLGYMFSMSWESPIMEPRLFWSNYGKRVLVFTPINLIKLWRKGFYA